MDHTQQLGKLSWGCFDMRCAQNPIRVYTVKDNSNTGVKGYREEKWTKGTHFHITTPGIYHIHMSQNNYHSCLLSLSNCFHLSETTLD